MPAARPAATPSASLRTVTGAVMPCSRRLRGEQLVDARAFELRQVGRFFDDAVADEAGQRDADGGELRLVAPAGSDHLLADGARRSDRCGISIEGVRRRRRRFRETSRSSPTSLMVDDQRRRGRAPTYVTPMVFAIALCPLPVLSAVACAGFRGARWSVRAIRTC